MRPLPALLSLLGLMAAPAWAASQERWNCTLSELCTSAECKAVPAHTGFTLALDRSAGTGLLTAKDSPEQSLTLIHQDDERSHWYSQGITRRDGYSGDTFVTLEASGLFSVSLHAKVGNEMKTANFSGSCTKK